MELTGKALMEYACSKFEERKYEEALEAFVLAYGKGFEQEWILENIYRCYMDGNEIEFQKSYQKQEDKLDCDYQECILDFIPCGEEEYFIFDKEAKIFRGKFSLRKLREAPPEPSFKGMEFSAALLALDWNLGDFNNILAKTKNRELYVVCQDLRRAASFCKIPELEMYMEHVRIFSDRRKLWNYFHVNTAIYLPQLIVGDKDTAEDLKQILQEEHRYRLTPEGRNTDNVLLTIGIPTHDRGNLVLKRLENLQKMTYDAEIEIVISKNGTHYYQEEYESIKEIKDARINYEGYNKELGMALNWQNVVKMAHGEFVLLVSDEDDVILGALEYYLKFLSIHKECGIVSASTVVQKSTINQNMYYKKGEDAFLGGFLRDNYLSGAIYNRELFLNSDIAYWDRHYCENSFYKLYPHLWWQVLLAFKGDYAYICKVLIQEGECVLIEETAKYRSDNVKESGLADGGMDKEYPNLPVPSTYKSRWEQFQGGIELINDYFAEDDDLKIAGWRELLEKTLYLMELVYDLFAYKTDEYPKWIGTVLSEALLALEQLGIGKEVQRQLCESILGYIKTKIKQSI